MSDNDIRLITKKSVSMEQKRIYKKINWREMMKVVYESEILIYTIVKKLISINETDKIDHQLILLEALIGQVAVVKSLSLRKKLLKKKLKEKNKEIEKLKILRNFYN